MCKPRTRGGTGLGLSICSKQVGVLGGVIGAWSCRSKGSTFWFKIPTYARSPCARTNSEGSSTAGAWEQPQPHQHQQRASMPIGAVDTGMHDVAAAAVAFQGSVGFAEEASAAEPMEPLLSPQQQQQQQVLEAKLQSPETQPGAAVSVDNVT